MTNALTRLAILDDYQGVALSFGPWVRLPEGLKVEVFREPLGGPDAVAERLAPYDAILAMRERTPFPRAVVERLPNLRLLITTGMRNRAIDVAACRERGITVCGTPSAGNPTVDLTWGLILSLARDIPGQQQALREGRWQTRIGVGLEGRTLGCIGLGNLGSRVARVGAAFGMRVLGWSQNLTEEAAAKAGATRVDKETLLRESDVVTIHLVLSERTRGLIGAAELALMKPTAFLVNTSRGPIVDQEALIAALRERRIAGAGLDVFDIEPLPPGHPILSAPNTVLTPHLGYVTEQNYRTYFEAAVEDVLAYLAGRPVRVLSP
ncbi:D-2-hydroxyacid dehydrogenase family protein [Caldovatus aquaticus]|uniref:D-2-hydroxyacid dehydrogenase family protein n=1 Tax=Caldovatus aquaticus TaxID=2865671 RepID=A0ABS7EZB0_9PROT|nr:D-2-hydroxyacid dehydrogenase family protein [Caldovatus aquaticus]MBW8267906.1 D-2-hydroxyacid dehydrogenase family protein [Caldovatus aquaticus]